MNNHLFAILALLCAVPVCLVGCKKYEIIEDIMVQTEDLGEYDYTHAEKVCRESTFGGYSDWRLPNKSELWCVLVKHNTVDNIAAAYYWSSTNGMQGCHYACRIFNFNTNGGNEINQSDNNECRVRAVRNLYGEDKE